MFSTKNLKRYGCLLAIVLAGVLLAGHIDIISAGIDEYGLSRTDGYLTTGTCSRSGVYTQKFVHNPSAHSSYTTHWSPGLPDLTFGYDIVVDGYGFIQASMTYSVNGLSGTKNWAPKRVGDWGHKGAFSLWVPHATRVTAFATGDDISKFDFDVPDAYGQYNWSSSGTANLQAMYCKRTAAFWGQWEPFGAPIPEKWNGQGSWELKKTFVCPNCNQDVPYTFKHRNSCSRINYRRHGWSQYNDTLRGCNAIFWECDSAAAAKHAPKTCSEPGCNGKYRTCAAIGHTCRPSNTGTTTSPTVQNNGGGTTGGTTGGTSADRVRCGHGRNGNACRYGGWASSREAHKTTCPAGHRYYACSAGGASKHANCRARNSGEVRCARGSLCRSGGWASSRNAHQTTCSAGHTYWSCWPASVSYHRRH